MAGTLFDSTAIAEATKDFLERINALAGGATITELSATASVAAAVIAVVTAFFHRRAEKDTWRAQRLFYLHEHLASPHYMDARRHLRDLLERNVPADKWDAEPKADLSPDRSADIVSACYDQAGILLFVPGGIAPRHQFYFLRSSWGQSIRQTFIQILEREDHLKSKQHDLKKYFRHFAEIAIAADDARSVKAPFAYWRWRWLRWRTARVLRRSRRDFGPDLIDQSTRTDLLKAVTALPEPHATSKAPNVVAQTNS